MKHTFSLLLAITFSLTFKSYSQEVNFTTATIDYGIWVTDPKSDNHWEMVGTPTEYISLFKISEAHTTLIHITDERKSTFFINHYIYNQDENRLELEVTSDAGNDYVIIIDDRKENIRFIYEDDGKMKLVRFKFKKVW